MPFSGSSPAWAALPVTVTLKSALPFLPIFTAPSTDASKTKTARALRDKSSISFLDERDPVSSSVVAIKATDPLTPRSA